MAFNSILRKSTSSLRPLVGQFLKKQRNYHSVLFTAISHNQVTLSWKPSFPLNPFFPSFDFSSKAAKNPSSDEMLIKVIESEIECAEETEDHNGVEEIPSGFPFEIRDSPGQQTILLERTYRDEEIKVEVQMPDLVTGENDDDLDQDDVSKGGTQSSIPLVVSVAKKGGSFLEFSCVAYPDEITIDSLAIKKPDNSEDQIAYEGPDFKDLDENLQKSLLKYLEVRGIKPSTTNFLHEYMINKDNKEYLFWLKKVRRFIEA
ncbi:hypothetical protein L6164_032970 [Bauhinia variegata]|uniref:Uncharacterized protein n=1 Tax=Bauhinia variegata TaxID=167791 RepID=A0ACB9KR51_BAUVA|nr:hypothetical protein L6164_032970 [Bauhinia variegata]